MAAANHSGKFSLQSKFQPRNEGSLNDFRSALINNTESDNSKFEVFEVKNLVPSAERESALNQMVLQDSEKNDHLEFLQDFIYPKPSYAATF